MILKTGVIAAIATTGTFVIFTAVALWLKYGVELLESVESVELVESWVESSSSARYTQMSGTQTKAIWDEK